MQSPCSSFLSCRCLTYQQHKISGPKPNRDVFSSRNQPMQPNRRGWGVDLPIRGCFQHEISSMSTLALLEVRLIWSTNEEICGSMVKERSSWVNMWLYKFYDVLMISEFCEVFCVYYLRILGSFCIWLLYFECSNSGDVVLPLIMEIFRWVPVRILVGILVDTSCRRRFFSIDFVSLFFIRMIWVFFVFFCSIMVFFFSILVFTSREFNFLSWDLIFF